jgi:hypothetical protein
MIFKINDKDFSNLVSGLKIGYEVLVGENSGRNANGDTVIDIVNRKRKIYVTLRHTTNAEMAAFLAAVEGYIVTVTYLDAKTNTLKTARTYIGTPEPEYYTITDRTLYKPLSLNFIEL